MMHQQKQTFKEYLMSFPFLYLLLSPSIPFFPMSELETLLSSTYTCVWLLLFSHSVMSNSLQPHGLKHARLPIPSPFPWVCPNSCPLSQWCLPTISSSVVPFSSCLQSLPASRFYLVSWLFTLGGQSIGASASGSVLPMNIQDWFPLGLTVWSCCSCNSQEFSPVHTINEVEFGPAWLECSFPKFIVAQRRVNLMSRELRNTKSP